MTFEGMEQSTPQNPLSTTKGVLLYSLTCIEPQLRHWLETFKCKTQESLPFETMVTLKTPK